MPATAGRSACLALVGGSPGRLRSRDPISSPRRRPPMPAYLPAGQLPAATASAPVPGGEAQRFVDGLDIPGQWWTLFQSPELNALIERALAAQPDARGRAGGAAAGERERSPPQRGALLSERHRAPSRRSAQKASRAAFGLPGQRLLSTTH